MTNHWNGFAAGDKVVMLIQTTGETPDGEEVVYSAGSYGVIAAIIDFGPPQGRGVEVSIGYSDRTIVNVFDDRDVRELGGVPMRAIRQTEATLTAEFQAWCDSQGLRQMSADELLCEDITSLQRSYIANFLARWNAATKRGDQ